MTNDSKHLKYVTRMFSLAVIKTYCWECNEAKLQVTHTHTHRRAADKRNSAPMRILCVEPAKCSPIIRWWCSGFCSLWLIISSFQSIWKQPINSIQVFHSITQMQHAKGQQRLGLVWLESKVKKKKGTFQASERARRQFSNPLIITLCCFSHFPLNLSVISIIDRLKNKPRQHAVMHSTGIHLVKWHAVKENSALVFWH